MSTFQTFIGNAEKIFSLKICFTWLVIRIQDKGTNYAVYMTNKIKSEDSGDMVWNLLL
jgi:hypothetical protein